MINFIKNLFGLGKKNELEQVKEMGITQETKVSEPTIESPILMEVESPTVIESVQSSEPKDESVAPKKKSNKKRYYHNGPRKRKPSSKKTTENTDKPTKKKGDK